MGSLIIPIPKDTREVYKNNRQNCDNAYLLLNRFLEGEDNGPNNPFETKKTKEKLYGQIQNVPMDPEPHVHRFERTLSNLKENGLFTLRLKLTTESRLIVGLGDTNALKVGMTLHPIYGFPYIPGSSLKGLCRAWLEVAEDTFNGEVLKGSALDDKIRRESHSVFGSLVKNEKDLSEEVKLMYKSDEDDAKLLDDILGNVTFFDAIPVDKPSFEIDIMNPHYGPYYSEPGKNPPADWHNPVPIKFLTLAPGTTFLFGLTSKDEQALQKAGKWLKSGLSELGIGAKTSSGYGYFNPEDLIEKKKRQEEEHLQKLQKEAATKAAAVTPATEKLYHRLENLDKTQLGSLIYKAWSEIEDEEEKIKGAQAIIDKFGKALKKKKKKAYAKDIYEWANKE